jgi:hypothetical protein
MWFTLGGVLMTIGAAVGVSVGLALSTAAPRFLVAIPSAAVFSLGAYVIIAVFAKWPLPAIAQDDPPARPEATEQPPVPREEAKPDPADINRMIEALNMDAESATDPMTKARNKDAESATDPMTKARNKDAESATD